MPIEPTQTVGALRPVDAGRARAVAAERKPAAAAAPPLVATSDALDPGPVPVDDVRVAEIRKAVESGTYPLLPAKVADAIIAAGLLLRIAK